eukprot:7010205-Prymnesium_polylepis.1
MCGCVPTRVGQRSPCDALTISTAAWLRPQIAQTGMTTVHSSPVAVANTPADFIAHTMATALLRQPDCRSRIVGAVRHLRAKDSAAPLCPRRHGELQCADAHSVGRVNDALLDISSRHLHDEHGERHLMKVIERNSAVEVNQIGGLQGRLHFARIEGVSSLDGLRNNRDRQWSHGLTRCQRVANALLLLGILVGRRNVHV